VASSIIRTELGSRSNKGEYLSTGRVKFEVGYREEEEEAPLSEEGVRRRNDMETRREKDGAAAVVVRT